MQESRRAREAYADYLAMGEARSLDKLHALYRTRTEPGPPTAHLSTLKHWSTTFGWQARLQAIADQAAAEAVAAITARRRAILEDGLALDFERVDVLKRVATRLLDEIENQGRLWVQDVKAIGSGETAERVDIERFNAAEVEQLRGLLDDIAKEKGERVKKLEHGGTPGRPIGVRHSAGRDKSDDFDFGDFQSAFAGVVGGGPAGGAAPAGAGAGEPVDPAHPLHEAGALPDGADA